MAVLWSVHLISPRGYFHAFRWTQGDGMVDLGTLPGGGGIWACSVSADGNIVVGFVDYVGAFRWTVSGGMEDLNQTYAYLLTNGSWLGHAYAISSDGRYIVGGGYNARTGRYEGFLLNTVPEPSSLLGICVLLAGFWVRCARVKSGCGR